MNNPYWNIKKFKSIEYIKIDITVTIYNSMLDMFIMFEHFRIAL